MSSGHVYARVVGFGCTVLPRAPYRLEQRGEGGVALEIRHGERGEVLRLRPGAEPLLAPSVDPQWEILWSSEDPQYRGSGRPPMRKAGTWNIPPHCAVVMYERNSY